MHRHRLPAVLTFALLVVAAACGDDADEPTLAPTTTAADGACPDWPYCPPSGRLDWAAVDEVDLGGGWSLADAEGDAPVVAVLRDGLPAGIVELGAFPVDSLPDVAAALDAGEDAALEAQAADFVEAFTADRLEGCGEAHQLVPEDVELVSAADGSAIRYGFAGRLAGEPVTERVLQWAAIRDDALVIVTAAAYDDGACVGTDGAELRVAALAEVEDRLAAAIEGSDLGTVLDVVELP